MIDQVDSLGPLSDAEHVRRIANLAADRLRDELQTMRRERDDARALLVVAADVIEGLADQQAMPDDFYVADLERIKREAKR